MSGHRCGRCGTGFQKTHRRWFEKLVMRAAYYCPKCQRRHYQLKLIGLII
ncbi:hypothetical protein Pla52n_13090 [Stieleria varia]|uniref:FPG-type domain-containing protein n=1 Tax=Stieleria varia TaxID=2528005 RepID=A0A5C6B550_9BACT|nr:hypothetical protein Pla52n_13090 [Stieleria varia]